MTPLATFIPRAVTRVSAQLRAPLCCRLQSQSAVRAKESQNESFFFESSAEPDKVDQATSDDSRRTRDISAPTYIPPWPTTSGSKPRHPPAKPPAPIDALPEPLTPTLTPKPTAPRASTSTTSLAENADGPPKKPRKTRFFKPDRDPADMNEPELALLAYNLEVRRVLALPQPEREATLETMPHIRRERKRLERMVIYERRELTEIQIARAEDDFHRRQEKTAEYRELKEALSPEELYEWRVAEQERTKTEGMNDAEKEHYLSLARRNRNINKFGLEEMRRRQNEKKMIAKYGYKEDKGEKEHKKQGSHPTGKRMRRQKPRPDGPKPSNPYAVMAEKK